MYRETLGVGHNFAWKGAAAAIQNIVKALLLRRNVFF